MGKNKDKGKKDKKDKKKKKKGKKLEAPGMTPPGAGPADANAAADGAAGAPVVPSTSGTVALGHTECDVVRGIGAPASVSLYSNPRGNRVAVVTYTQGQLMAR